MPWFLAGKPLLEAAYRGDAERVRELIGAGEPVDPDFDSAAARERAGRVFGPGGTCEEQVAAMLAGLADDHPLKKAMAIEPSAMAESRVAFTRQFNEGMVERMASGAASWEIPLFVAAQSGSGECVRLLIAAGARVSRLDSSGHTALFHAGSPAVVRELMAAGVDPMVADEYHRDALREHLERLGDDGAENERVTAVCAALLEAGVPLVRSVREGAGRLYEAAFVENPHAVRFLLRAGHPPLDCDSVRASALHAICWHWDHGDERDAATRDIVRQLLAAGISPHLCDARGNTPLHEAVAGDGVNLVAAEELLAAGADINAQNGGGDTPLVYHYENSFEYGKAVPFLIERGANPLIANARGRNAIDVARRMIQGKNPDWREGLRRDDGGELCGWKGPAAPGDGEYELLALLERAAERIRA